MGSGSYIEKKFKKAFWNFVEGRLTLKLKVAPELSSILVLRPDRLGDLALSIPALLSLRQQLKASTRMSFVAGDRNADLIRFFFPESKVWIFKKNIFSRLGLFLRLWLGYFDEVIDLHSYPFSTTTALLALSCKAPIRIGFWATGDFEEYRELSRKIFHFGTEAPPESLSETEKSLRLVSRAFLKFKPKLAEVKLPQIPSATVRAVKDFYEKAGIKQGDKVLGIHPTIRKQDNRWSQENYEKLIQRLTSVKGLKIVVVHGRGEAGELERFQNLTAGFSNVFTLPSDDLFFILEAAKNFDGMVCNDSGLMHVCAWVTPLFAVFGPSNAKRWGPRNQKGIKHRVFQTKNGLCDSVKAEQVAGAVRKALL